jgi:hypothetical protein
VELIPDRNISATDDTAVTLLNYIQTQQPLTKILVASAIAEGAISSKFSMLHSSKNSRIGDGCDPTDMYAMRAKFFTRPDRTRQTRTLE